MNLMHYFYNAHTHIFKLKHVPNLFARGYFSLFGLTVSITWLRRIGVLPWLVRKLPELRKKDHDMAERLINIVKHGAGPDGKGRSQKDVFNNLQSYYPRNTRFIVLPMDMAYMNAGEVPEPYVKQIEQLEALKEEYRERIYPFIFAEPRRLQKESDHLDFMKDKLKSGKFAGIKMYPALGYWPFDDLLEGVMDYALEHQLPIMSHCVHGVVHDRGKKVYHVHPANPDAKLEGRRSRDFTRHFSHPINFHCLMDQAILSKLWKREAPDYFNLKMCLAHFGGSDEWQKYLKNPWVADKTNGEEGSHPELHPDNWSFKLETEEEEYSWFSVIKAMIHHYPNVYADISFMLYDKELWGMLKMLLQTDKKLRTRVLFGTDFYVVAQKGTERELSIGVRSFLGEELFEQIAKTNVEEYLSTSFTNFQSQ